MSIVCVCSIGVTVDDKGCPQAIQVTTVLGIINLVLKKHLGVATDEMEGEENKRNRLYFLIQSEI